MQDVPELLSRPFPRAPLIGAAVMVGLTSCWSPLCAYRE